MPKRNAVSILLASTIAFAMIASTSCSKGDAAQSGKGYRFATVTKGTIEKTVSSSGNLEPVSTVSVLSEMSGRVEKVNADYNDKVSRGQVLVQINTDMLELQQLEEIANVKKISANRELQLLDFNNKSKLAEKGLISEYDLKSAQTSLDVLSAELDSANASLSVIETKIKDYAYIKSPIAGIVLERNVDEGQSVVEGSSSNSSSLFTIAENLENMEIKAKVDELDIASIKKGMKVRFTVEALTDESFTGSVKEVRLVPETTNNVVNYYVMVAADNRSGELLPGMTAEVTFIESVDEGVLLVPNSALRFMPSSISSDETAKMVFMARLGDMGAEDKAKAVEAYEKQKKASASGSSGQQGMGGLTGVMMGPRPGGRGDARRNAPGGPQGFEGDAAAKRSSASSTSVAASGGGAGKRFDPSSLKTLWFLNDEGDLDVRLVIAGTSDGTNTVISAPGGDDGLEGLKAIVQEEVK